MPKNCGDKVSNKSKCGKSQNTSSVESINNTQNRNKLILFKGPNGGRFRSKDLHRHQELEKHDGYSIY